MTDESVTTPPPTDTAAPHDESDVVVPEALAQPDPDDAEAEDESVTTLVSEPAKVMRIGTMVKQLLEEVRAAPLDEAARERLAAIHTTSISELSSGLAPEVAEELERLALPFSETEAPSESELRVAQAQLVGWLEGLFHGIQTALVAQHVQAQSQLTQLRQLPPGVTIVPAGGRGGPGGPGGSGVGPAGAPGTPRDDDGTTGTGQYL